MELKHRIRLTTTSTFDLEKDEIKRLYTYLSGQPLIFNCPARTAVLPSTRRHLPQLFQLRSKLETKN